MWGIEAWCSKYQVEAISMDVGHQSFGGWRCFYYKVVMRRSMPHDINIAIWPSLWPLISSKGSQPCLSPYSQDPQNQCTEIRPPWRVDTASGVAHEFSIVFSTSAFRKPWFSGMICLWAQKNLLKYGHTVAQYGMRVGPSPRKALPHQCPPSFRMKSSASCSSTLGRMHSQPPNTAQRLSPGPSRSHLRLWSSATFQPPGRCHASNQKLAKKHLASCFILRFPSLVVTLQNF